MWRIAELQGNLKGDGAINTAAVLLLITWVTALVSRITIEDPPRRFTIELVIRSAPQVTCKALLIGSRAANKITLFKTIASPACFTMRLPPSTITAAAIRAAITGGTTPVTSRTTINSKENIEVIELQPNIKTCWLAASGLPVTTKLWLSCLYSSSCSQVSQEPIGRRSGSNPATYIKIQGGIRKLFSQQRLAVERKYTPGIFRSMPGEHVRNEGAGDTKSSGWEAKRFV